MTWPSKAPRLSQPTTNSASSKAQADATVAAIQASGAQAVALNGNLTTTDAVEKLCTEAIAVIGKPDIAVNTVGKVLKRSFTEISEAEPDPVAHRSALRASGLAAPLIGAPSVFLNHVTTRSMTGV